MNLRWILGLSLLVAAVLVYGSAFADDLGSITGSVRDAGGKPIEGAMITLTARQTGVVVVQVTSDVEGQYQCDRIPLGEFKVSVTFEGYVAPPARPVTISQQALHAEVDFALTVETSKVESKAANQSPSTPKFEAAGVRGLIDPGGYSAGANASAASGLIKEVADVKRGDKDPGESAEDVGPCALEPGLKTEVEANPDSSVAKQKLGNFYVAHKEPRKAIPLLERAHQIEGSNAGIAKDLAIAYLKNEQFDAARELLTVLAEKQNDATIHELLARAEEGSGMYLEASQQYKMALISQPSEENFFAVGYELILAGKPAEATHAFQEGISPHPGSIKLLLGLGTAEFLQGNPSAGIRSILHATDLAPADPAPYALLASASAIHTEESSQIRDALQRFAEIAPDNPDASYDYALSLWNLHRAGFSAADMNHVEGLLKQAIERKPDFANAHFLLAEVYSQRADYKDAVREYNATLRWEPQRTEAHYRLADVYRHTGRKDLAAQELHLFQEEKEAQPVSGGSLSAEQFVSVIAPRGAPSTTAYTCPEGKP
jgi:tetratricopeptide (TPR) repeat protein